MYEDENNLYHYSYRKGDEQNPSASATILPERPLPPFFFGLPPGFLSHGSSA